MSDVIGRPTLVGFSGGDAARAMRAWSDKQVVNAAMSALRQAFR